MKTRFLTIFLSLFWAGNLFASEVEVGIYNSNETNLPSNLWTSEILPDAIELLERSKTTPYAAINNLRNNLALSSSDPKLNQDDSELLMAARLTLLYTNGALDGGEALMNIINWTLPNLRPTIERIALMTSRPDQYCSQLIANQFPESEKGMTIYCLVRLGNYPEAKLIFDSQSQNWSAKRRENVGQFLNVDESTQALEEPWTELPDPIDFVMGESLGRPRGNIPLPPPYAYFSREIGTAPQQDLEFTEDLTRSGALPSNVLFAAYRTFQSQDASPANDRAKLIQSLSDESFDPEKAEFDLLIKEIYYQFSEAHLLDPMATQLAPYLRSLDLANLSNPSTRNTILRLSLIGGWSKKEWSAFLPPDDFNLILAFKIRHPEAAFGLVPNYNTATPLLAKIADVDFNKSLETTPNGVDILDALKILENAQSEELVKIQMAFSTLITAGQQKEARDIALSLIFGGNSP